MNSDNNTHYKIAGSVLSVTNILQTSTSTCILPNLTTKNRIGQPQIYNELISIKFMVFREANSESYRTGQPKDYNHSLYMNKKTEKKKLSEENL